MDLVGHGLDAGSTFLWTKWQVLPSTHLWLKPFWGLPSSPSQSQSLP